MAIILSQVLVGAVAPLGPRRVPSAIAKQPVSGAVPVSTTGLAGDAVGDSRVHGGVDKAVHHYPFDHYAAWRAEIGAHDLLAAPGAFGENLTTTGATEADICVGDLWRIGTVLLEVSQPRQPCWKLNVRFAVADMARRVQDSGRTGWYYRVREAGRLGGGDVCDLVDRPHPDWPLTRLQDILVRRVTDPGDLEAMTGLAVLAESWRRLARRRLERGRVEDWSDRLEGTSE